MYIIYAPTIAEAHIDIFIYIQSSRLFTKIVDQHKRQKRQRAIT